MEVIGTYIGDGAPMLIRRALGDPADRDFLQEALNYFLLYYREHKLDSTCVYEGIRDGSAADWPSATGASASWRCSPINRCGSRATFSPDWALAGSFFQVYGGNSFDTKKPDPLGANTLMREAGAHPRRNGDGGRFAGRHPDRAQCRNVERRRDLWLRSAYAGASRARRAGRYSGRAGAGADGEYVINGARQQQVFSLS